jgi:hypothetical protein|tara:strand:- start:903 stop:1571 length:669 start_codon:yes stop_codon:yes gene_type:complete
MAKTSYLGANIAVSTDTFREWIERTNQLIYDSGTILVTVGAVATPNSTNHTTTSGNGYVNGIFSANTLAVTQTLRGGTVDTAASMNVGSNVMPTANLTLDVGSATYAFGNAYFNNVRAFGDLEASYSSDLNLKTDLKSLENALEVVENINGYMFEWKTDDHKNGTIDLGVIAQEVEKELPFLVSTNGNGHLSVKYQSLIPLLIEAIKQLNKKVKDLEEKDAT